MSVLNFVDQTPVEPIVATSLQQVKIPTRKKIRTGVTTVFFVATGITAFTSNYQEPIPSNLDQGAYTRPDKSLATANRYELLGSYTGVNKTVDNSQIGYDDEFEFGIVAMDNLDNIGFMPAKNSKTMNIDLIKPVQGRIIEPDEEDFFYAVDMDNL